MRNIILLRILAETALRSYNILNLTWKPDNTGQLRRDRNGHYKIEISWTEFKNSESRFFGASKAKHNYKINLSSKLTPLIDKYLLRTRDFLLNKWAAYNKISGDIYDQGFLFVKSGKSESQGITHSTSRKILVKLALTELVYNPLAGSGIEGVETFGMHCVRHITATHVLKMNGSYEVAANAIQDAPDTVRAHYARYLPSDRDKTFRSIITDLAARDYE